MAIAVTIRKRNRVGTQYSNTVDLAFDNSYTGSGGEALTAANLGLTVVEGWSIPANSGYSFNYDPTNSKILVYASGGVAAHTHNFKIVTGAAAAGTDAISAKVLTLGKESAADITIVGANSATLGGVVASTAITTGAAAEVTAATDLSALTAVRATFWGR